MEKNKKNHKKIYIILAVVLICAIMVFIWYGFPYIQRHYLPVHVNEAEVTTGEKIEFGNKKALVVYLSLRQISLSRRRYKSISRCSH